MKNATCQTGQMSFVPMPLVHGLCKRPYENRRGVPYLCSAWRSNTRMPQHRCWNINREAAGFLIFKQGHLFYRKSKGSFRVMILSSQAT